MPSSERMLVTIDCQIKPDFNVPVPVTGEPLDRATTIFHMTDKSSGLSLIGTYDHIMDFAAGIGQVMMSWPLVAGRHEWFGSHRDFGSVEREQNAREERESAVRDNGYGRDSGARGDGDGVGSGSEGSQPVPGRQG